MAVTLISYLESIAHCSARLRTITGMQPHIDSRGRPLFVCGSRTVTFNVTWREKEHLLHCPLSLSPAAKASVERYALESVYKNNRFVASCNYMRGELLVYDTAGCAVWQDIMLEESLPGLRLTQFIRNHLFASDRKPFRTLLRGIAEMAVSLHKDDMVHGNMRPGNIIVDDEGIPRTANYPFSTKRETGCDYAALAALAAGIFVTACEPPIYTLVESGQMSLPLLPDNTYRSILAQAELLRIKPLTDLLRIACSSEEIPHRILHKALTDIAETPFVPMPIVAGISNPGAVKLGSEWRKQTEYTGNREDISLLVDFRRCEHIGELSDTLIRFRERETWGFADRYGNRLTSEDFLDAGDFFEGRAVVESAEGWGLIDRQGKYIMPAQFEAMEWHGQDNVISACRDGKWELYDREGRQLTAGSYDWIGDCSENKMVVRRGNKLGYLNTDGVSLTDMRFDDAYSFRNSKAMVRIGNDTYHIGPDGHKINY